MGAFLREPAPLVRLVCLAKIWVGFFFQGFSANWGFLEQGFGGSTPEGWGGGDLGGLQNGWVGLLQGCPGSDCKSVVHVACANLLGVFSRDKFIFRCF